jgi:hypothetical protein
LCVRLAAMREWMVGCVDETVYVYTKVVFPASGMLLCLSILAVGGCVVIALFVDMYVQSFPQLSGHAIRLFKCYYYFAQGEALLWLASLRLRDKHHMYVLHKAAFLILSFSRAYRILPRRIFQAYGSYPISSSSQKTNISNPLLSYRPTSISKLYTKCPSLKLP